MKLLLRCIVLLLIQFHFILNSFGQKDTAFVNKKIKLAYDLRYVDTQKSIETSFKALQYAKEIDYKFGMAKAYNEISKAYFLLENYNKALKYILKGIPIAEKSNDDQLLSACYISLANVYVMEYQHDLAIVYLDKALSKAVKVNDGIGIANVYNSKGYSFYRAGKYAKAIPNYYKSIEKSKQIGYKRGVCNSYQNIGHVYFDQGILDSALIFYEKSLPISIEIADLQLVAKNYLKIAEIHSKRNDLQQTESCLKNGLVYAEKMGISGLLCDFYKEMALLFEKKKQIQLAFLYAKKYTVFNDSLNEKENAQKTGELQFSFEIERKEKEQLKKENETRKKHELSLKKRNRLIYFSLTGIAVLFLLAGFIYRSSKLKQKANILLESKNQQIESQRLHLEEKNRDITDSITYAKRIQLALLKKQEIATENLYPHFILYQSKEIVSGDFYWTFEKENYVYLAAGDCTGHGVPGAFLTMLGIAFLNEINAGNEILTPSQILDSLKLRITKELSQTGKEDDTKDGMDISLARLNVETNELQWSGANNPLWIIKNGNELIETKANKQPIGYSSKSTLFTNHSFVLAKNDVFYLFTDGYADQFGGPNGKKFKYSQLKENLLSIAILEPEIQKQILNEKFENWKGNLEQLDDVCIIGVQIP